MRGIAIRFDGSKPTLDFQNWKQGFAATTQNALVNLATRAGSDPVFTDRGTKLREDGYRGRMLNKTWANRQANYAALSTLAFVRKVETQATEGLQSLQMKTSRIQNGSVEFLVKATSTEGEVIGNFLDI